jgi:hypothetical protein
MICDPFLGSWNCVGSQEGEWSVEDVRRFRRIDLGGVRDLFWEKNKGDTR